MLEMIKKTMFTGLGLAYLSKGKVEGLAKELANLGKLSEKEGKEFAEELLAKSEEARKELEGQIEKVVKGLLQKMDIATKEDLAKLEAQLLELKKDIEKKAAG